MNLLVSFLNYWTFNSLVSWFVKQVSRCIIAASTEKITPWKNRLESQEGFEWMVDIMSGKQGWQLLTKFNPDMIRVCSVDRHHCRLTTSAVCKKEVRRVWCLAQLPPLYPAPPGLDCEMGHSSPSRSPRLVYILLYVHRSEMACSGKGGGGGGGWNESVKNRPRIPSEKDRRDRGPPPEQWKC